MLSALKQFYRQMRLVWRLVYIDEGRYASPMPLRHRINFLRKGFLSQASYLYDLERFELSDYFSDWAKARMSMMYDRRNVRAGYQYGLNNKLFATAILGQHVPVPRILGVIEHGRYLSLEQDDKSQADVSWLKLCEQVGGGLVAKPLAGSSGQGVLMIQCQDKQLFLNESPVTEETIWKRIQSLDEYLVCVMIVQGKYARSLYPETTNTIRMVTLCDPNTGSIHVPIAVQRIGTHTSRPVDNWFHGGLSAEVDLSSGRLGPAASRDIHTGTLSWHDTHPEQGTPIKGQVVPRWDDIVASIRRAASNLGFFKFLSWDVVVTDDGFTVLEADTVSGITMLQVHRPLLRDTIFRSFMEHHGFVRPDAGLSSERR